MKTSHEYLVPLRRMLTVMLGFALALGYSNQAQEAKKGPAQQTLTGSYEGSAKNNAGEVIAVTLDLTEKEGALSGIIHSTHGDFTITEGSRKADAVTIAFDANGATGTISMKWTGDQLSGTWSAGDDGGTIDAKKSAAQEGGAKGKS